MISCIKADVSPKGHYSGITCRTGGTTCCRHGNEKRGLPGGQALLTLPSQLASLTTGELKEAENWLQLKHIERKWRNSSFPTQLDSGLLSAITSRPAQDTSGSHPPILGWIYTDISQDLNMLCSPRKSKHMLQSVGLQNWNNLYGVLTTKSEYLRSLHKIYCLPTPSHSTKGYLVQKLETAICTTYPARQEPPLN